ncbi:MAG: FKBP-type peptidyl-prolyl cis-trans isomerase [Sphingomonadales bacterium]|jgi:FKBP-type peptidyl-prolyl cis-trans isomerase FkpA|nr:FKBP-type peptidyl-prolyl cis-trans isomerase [Sphingomonadales bacterium]MBK9004543.1 FKBP-type peptidyl-prolyl cis-trans isomerase [Sphingomonadales bacterium]MBK9269730.1 FKBP-type peptidyl-prolyl cis-trans isomerase [Sphingomonadales bacterium]MBP6434433.1 FKBP-type peptidyl-prolyl cis-trans isomerase [Sphingorhabdus sp.]
MSVTTVPIQPIKKGSLPKFWAGIAIIALAGAGLAWWGTKDIRSEYASDAQFLADNADEDGVTVTKSGLQIQTIRGGEGKPPTDNDVAMISITGTLRDGKVFQEPASGPFPVSGGIPGFTEALKLMQKGGKYKIWIPSELGYGPNDVPDQKSGGIAIPGGSTLIFDVELQDFLPREQFEAAMKQQQEQMQKAAEAAGQGAPIPQN